MPSNEKVKKTNGELRDRALRKLMRAAGALADRAVDEESADASAPQLNAATSALRMVLDHRDALGSFFRPTPTPAPDLVPAPERRRFVPEALRVWAARIQNEELLYPSEHRWETVQVINHLAQMIEAADREGVNVRAFARWTLAALAVADVELVDKLGAVEIVRISREQLAEGIKAQTAGAAWVKAHKHVLGDVAAAAPIAEVVDPD